MCVSEHHQSHPPRGGRGAKVNMERDQIPNEPLLPDDEQIIEPVEFTFGLKRRTFVQLMATGLMIAAAPLSTVAQQRGGGGETRNLAARIHIGKDGIVTVLTGKVEMGQGSRGELTQAAAEELRVALDQIQLKRAWFR